MASVHRDQGEDASRADVWRYAGELLYRFRINGPIIPYYGRVAWACWQE